MELAKSGKYFLNRHHHPAQSTEQEKAGFIPDGQGNYYITINLRTSENNSPSKEAATTVSPEPIAKNTAPTAATRPGRGGSRAGAGRPAVKTKIKRVPLQGARVPGWLMDWLKAEGDMGHKIEVALIDYYGLTPPG
jgi:hypothetical protein